MTMRWILAAGLLATAACSGQSESNQTGLVNEGAINRADDGSMSNMAPPASGSGAMAPGMNAADNATAGNSGSTTNSGNSM
jgi:hypothetical protein